MTDRLLRRRRLLALLGTGGATALAGCNRLFTEPGGDETPTPTPTPPSTPTPTPTPTSTPTPTPAASTPARGVSPITINGYTIAFEAIPGDFAAAEIDVTVQNEGDREVRQAAFRIALVFQPATTNRTVAVDYVGSRFDDGLDEGQTGELSYRTRFPTDGRAEGSTDPTDFGLRFRIVRVEFE